MKTKKIYPFINAHRFDNCHVICFDAREVEMYEVIDEEADGTPLGADVYFKSGNVVPMSVDVDPDVYPGDNLLTLIDMVGYGDFWHDNEDAAPDDDEK